MHSVLCMPCLPGWQMICRKPRHKLNSISGSTLVAPVWLLCTVFDMETMAHIFSEVQGAGFPGWACLRAWEEHWLGPTSPWGQGVLPSQVAW